MHITNNDQTNQPNPLIMHNIETMQGVYFMSGIDTDIGKTVATGILAKQLLLANNHVITQKMVQTGCNDMADDILTHRHIMAMPLQPVDHQRLTMPQIFRYPASPHLACQLDNQTLDIQHIHQATNTLKAQYDTVLIEGAGGLMVPLTDNILIIDYIKQHNYPVILVTSGKLGSINHTLLSLNAIKHYNLNLYALIFNHIHDYQDILISTNTYQFLQNYLCQHFAKTNFWSIPHLRF